MRGGCPSFLYHFFPGVSTLPADRVRSDGLRATARLEPWASGRPIGSKLDRSWNETYINYVGRWVPPHVPSEPVTQAAAGSGQDGRKGITLARISFSLNGRSVEFKGDGDRRLLWVLRADFGLTGSKYGCGEGICGACTVLVDGKAARSCQVSVGDMSGHRVLTIEGLAQNGRLHPIQEAFVEEGALQCGFCTPGMVLTAYSFLKENPSPTEAEIIRAMDDNLCRCGAHVRIIRAIQKAAGEMRRVR